MRSKNSCQLSAVSTQHSEIRMNPPVSLFEKVGLREIYMPRHKRPRGGQPGNQNARKHGFYAKQLSPQESCEYWNIINTTGISPESAVLRLKMQSVFRNAPANYPVLRDISKLLVKYCGAQFL